MGYLDFSLDDKVCQYIQGVGDNIIRYLLLLKIWNDTQDNITQVLPAFLKRFFVHPFIWFAYIKCRPICFLARSQNNRLISDHPIEVAPRSVGGERLKKVLILPKNRNTDCDERLKL